MHHAGSFSIWAVSGGPRDVLSGNPPATFVLGRPGACWSVPGPPQDQRLLK